jgi:hypothetical protein
MTANKKTDDVFKNTISDTDKLKWNKEYLKKKIGDKKEIRLSFEEMEEDGYTLHLFDRKTFLKNTKMGDYDIDINIYHHYIVKTYDL